MERTETFKLNHPKITIENATGDITLLPSTDGSTKVLVSSSSKSAESILEEVTIANHGQSVEILAVPKRKTFNLGKRITIDFDRKVEIQVWHPAEASIEIKSVSSDIACNGAAREINVSSLSGDVEVGGAIERFDLKTVSGKVAVHRSPADIGKVKTISGGIQLSVQNTCDAELKTVSGDIEVFVDPNLLIEVDAQSLSGKLSSTIDLSADGEDSAASGRPFFLRSKSISGNVAIQRSEARNGSTQK
jgi:hypothetical protein